MNFQKNLIFGLRFKDSNIYKDFYDYVSLNKINFPVSIDHEAQEAEPLGFNFVQEKIHFMRVKLTEHKNKFCRSGVKV